MRVDRILFACLGMVPVLLLHRVRFTRPELRLLLISATFGVPVQFLLQFHGLARTTVSHASLMVGCMPVLLAAAAALFAGERLDRIGWVALFASTAGAALIVLGGSRGPAAHGQPTLIGDLMVVASLCTSLAWILVSKKLMLTHSPLAVTAYTILVGTVMLAVWILGPWIARPWLPNHSQPPPFAHVSATAWAALAISGLACTATTTLLWNWGIHHVPASRAGVFLNIEPALGSFLGVKLLGEHGAVGMVRRSAAAVRRVHGNTPRTGAAACRDPRIKKRQHRVESRQAVFLSGRRTQGRGIRVILESKSSILPRQDGRERDHRRR
jgi:drug/metabolite transporter (DMT)-like permease